MMEERILESLGRLDEEIIAQAALLRDQKPRHRAGLFRWASLAACLMVVLLGALTAEASTGSVSNLLAPLFGCARTELMDDMGVPVGASVTVEGYTLTAEAVIGDRHNCAMVYTLRREDGQAVPENVYFDQWSAGFRGSGSSVLSYQRSQEDPTELLILHYVNNESAIIGRKITTTFQDLMLEQENGGKTLLAEGNWSLSFALRYPDSTQVLRGRNLPLTDQAGRRYELKRVELSSIGVYLELTMYQPETLRERSFVPDFTAGLRLKDGTLLELEGGGGASWREGDAKTKVHYNAILPRIVPLSEMEALVLCGVELPLSFGD